MNNITIEIPDYLVEYALENYPDQNFIAYGSLPFSPLSGGRPQEYIMNNLFEYLKCDVSEVTEKYFELVEDINNKDVPYFIAFNNLMYCKSEYGHHGRETDLLSRLSKSNLNNGVIVANHVVELWVRQNYSNLKVISSCQRFCSPDGMGDDERIREYSMALRNFDLVTLSFEDNSRLDIIGKLSTEYRDKIILITNPRCGADCNRYWHYLQISLLNNKIPPEKIIPSDKLKHIDDCVSRKRPAKILDSETIKQLLERGVRNFKVVRSSSIDRNKKHLDELIKNLHS